MLSIWKSALPNLFLNLGAVWIQFGAVWINLKTLSVKWRSHCLGLTVLTYCGQFLVVSICQYVTKSISKFRRNVNKILFLRYRRENGGHISWPLSIYCRICFTFVYAIVILKNEFEIMVCKISAILSLPGCVNTLWQRQSDPYFEDNIFNFICNFRWNLNKT